MENKIILKNDDLVKVIHNLKQNNEKIVLTSGCFDILHVGHLKLLKESKKMGDKLIVLLSSDEQIKFLKGESRPVNNLEDRLNLFKVLPYVDYIIPYTETLTNKNEEILDYYINLINPDIWAKGSDYTVENILKLHPSLKSICLIDLETSKSTTNIINKIKSNNNH
jgi:D-beta-D-heptose 7-phosphate kinase/D-beta-D-heptose 1-phosphate adenosyltransferase